MSTVTVSLWAFCMLIGIIVVMVIGLIIFQRKATKSLALAQKARELAAEMEVIVSQRAENQETVKELAETHAILTARLETVTAQSVHYFSLIEGVIAERDRWIRICRKAWHQGGVAQQWLMRDLSRSIKIINDYRKREGKKPISVDPAFKEIMGEYQDLLGNDEVRGPLASETTAKPTPELPSPEH